jgi:hypothetical protein
MWTVAEEYVYYSFYDAEKKRKARNMKKGDIVTIKDGSFTQSVVNGELIHEWLVYGTEQDKQYVVIETNCMFPNSGSRGYPYSPPTFNDTVIQQCESGRVVFIEERFLHLRYTAPKPVREVTMAEVCKQFGEDVKIKKEKL